MHGFKVIGDDNLVIVSSEVPAQHFVGKATYQGIISSALSCFPAYSSYGGNCGAVSCYSVISPYGSSTICTGGGGLEGRTVYSFSIVMPNMAAPLVFIKPTSVGAQYGIISMAQQNFTWYITVLQRYGVVNVPVLYVFSECEGMTSSETTGMLLKDANGKTTYDSRFNLLNIRGSADVVPPEYAASGGVPNSSISNSKEAFRDNSLDFDFRTTDSRVALNHGVLLSNIMFSAPSTAQAVWQRTKGGWYISDGGKGQDAQVHESQYDWWVMYHQTYGVTSSEVIAGWGMYTAGYKHYVYIEGESNFGGIGNSGDSTSVGGEAPYRQKSINRRHNTILVSDSSLYD